MNNILPGDLVRIRYSSWLAESDNLSLRTFNVDENMCCLVVAIDTNPGTSNLIEGKKDPPRCYLLAVNDNGNVGLGWIWINSVALVERL